MKFLVFHGTLRKGQFTEYVTKFVTDVASRRDGHEFEIIDPRKLNLPFDDEGGTASPPELTRKVEEADGFVVVAPEYNHGYPGSLKYVLDLNLKAYIHKPVALVGVSAGPYGGTRVIEALLPVVRELGLAVTFTDLNVSMVKEEIEDGKLKDEEKWARRTDRMLDELMWMAETFKWGRENLE